MNISAYRKRRRSAETGQQAIAAEVPETIDARARAYLLLKRHGQEVFQAGETEVRRMRCPRVVRLLRGQDPWTRHRFAPFLTSEF
jgi:hypothetical protein